MSSITKQSYIDKILVILAQVYDYDVSTTIYSRVSCTKDGKYKIKHQYDVVLWNKTREELDDKSDYIRNKKYQKFSFKSKVKYGMFIVELLKQAKNEKEKEKENGIHGKE